MRKNILRNTLRIFALSAMLVAGIAAHAVTPEEMERARAVAATVYLRYTNDKSDYLDNFKPQTMSEVRDKVKNHEVDAQNLNQFMNAPVAKDFATWDKDELVAYWGGKFFENSGLSQKASKARNNKITARLRTMDVTPPAAEPAPAPDTAQQQTPYNGYQDADMKAVQQPESAAVTDSATTATDDQKVVVNKKGDNSIVLIIILIVLIIIVICLVTYALKTMRKNKNVGSSPDSNVRFEPQTSMVIEDQPSPRQTPAGGEYIPRPAQPESNAELKYARIIQQKNEMIESLRSQLDESRRHTDNQAALINRLQADVQRLGEEMERLRNTPRTVSPLPAPGRPVSEAPRPRRYETPQPRPAAPAHSDSEMVIYLGRANHDKVFVRADKQLTHGKSIYRMVTSNGLTGSFYVDTDPAVVGLVSLDPQAALSGACEVPTFANADNFTRIVTDTAGTAIFEDGCWKVLRPAAVHLE